MSEPIIPESGTFRERLKTSVRNEFRWSRFEPHVATVAFVLGALLAFSGGLIAFQDAFGSPHHAGASLHVIEAMLVVFVGAKMCAYGYRHLSAGRIGGMAGICAFTGLVILYGAVKDGTLTAERMHLIWAAVVAVGLSLLADRKSREGK